VPTPPQSALERAPTLTRGFSQFAAVAVADAFVACRTETGHSALHAAAAAHDVGVCRLLLERTSLPTAGEDAKARSGALPRDCAAEFQTEFDELCAALRSAHACFLSHHKQSAGARPPHHAISRARAAAALPLWQGRTRG
jgi:hypothetical protein